MIHHRRPGGRRRTNRSRAYDLLALLVLGVVLTGCGATPNTDPDTATSPPPPPVAEPTAITIPAIDAHSTLVPLGLTLDGELEVPPVDQPMQAGWYAGPNRDEPGDEVPPGAIGPAVIAGHVDGQIDGRGGQPGIFHQLHTLHPGDDVIVDRADNTRAHFIVDRVERYPKQEFPTAAVYGDTTGPELRLITCGGPFDHAEDSYRDNWVVYASLADTEPQP